MTLTEHCEILREWVADAQSNHPELNTMALSIQAHASWGYAYTLSGFATEIQEMYVVGVGRDANEALNDALKQI